MSATIRVRKARSYISRGHWVRNCSTRIPAIVQCPFIPERGRTCACLTFTQSLKSGSLSPREALPVISSEDSARATRFFRSCMVVKSRSQNRRDVALLEDSKEVLGF